ncbi:MULTISPECIES: OmpH family outer membrane protein [unclassified Gilvimarinus]|uniref:OmpH family outer membrane protein n=1 Tax=unclassified Gilvimarinus TaxID=2642066 RepID=UPI0026E3980F|nr:MULTISPECIES: OmpH family outer membrane protein [unclassified Gilvimarinus]MDO6571640.1 OmpH family outer membrane protein [Gilvimarinus sp. 2_MG-2023]MDO6745712.1 OmpH family outer membrane protein [Gilvimarinus sp. 1_MG-2023]
MTFIKRILLASALMVTSVGALAEGKVVVLDAQRAMLATDLAKKTVDGLQKNAEFTALRAKVESLVADLQALQGKAEKDSMTWSEDQVAEHRKKVEYLRADYELAQKKMQSEQQQILQKVQQQLQPKIPAILEQLTKDEKIGMIINAQSVFFADPDHDITALLVEKLNDAE